MRLPQGPPPLSHRDFLKLQVGFPKPGILPVHGPMQAYHTLQRGLPRFYAASHCSFMLCNTPEGGHSTAEELRSHTMASERAYPMWCHAGRLQAIDGPRIVLMQMLQQHRRRGVHSLQRRALYRQMRAMPACRQASLKCVYFQLRKVTDCQQKGLQSLCDGACGVVKKVAVQSAI